MKPYICKTCERIIYVKNHELKHEREAEQMRLARKLIICAWVVFFVIFTMAVIVIVSFYNG